MWPQLQTQHFPPEVESQFQARYYARVRSTLRLVAPLMVVLLLVSLGLSVRFPTPYDLAVAWPQLAFWSLLFGLTWVSGFGRWWQPVVVGLGCLAAGLVLGRLAPLLLADIADLRAQGHVGPTVAQQKFYFIVQFAVLLVSFAMLRLQVRWAALLYAGVLVLGVWAFTRTFPGAPQQLLDARFILLPAALIVCVLLLTATIEEQLARGAFGANFQLEAERNDEKRGREATEGKLHVLNSAIGGVVHDLGNPLTSVQSGAELVDRLLRDEQQDLETLLEVNDMVQRGAKMLNFLRLSLIEQSRVLEGQPVPVELKPVSVRAIVEAGVSFQKARFAQGHSLSLEEEDYLICADEMKMVTVLMNLIGNALKYSDGQVRVVWHPHGDCLQLAVLDEGKEGRGLSKSQAARLFVPFGRLETHAEIEGTGLGLLSVQKVVEAHGGQVWIEGFEDGTPESAPFSTRPQNDLSMLSSPSRTAFVLTCPLA